MKRRPHDSDSDEIAATAAEWIGRSDGGLTPAEQLELEQWREADPRHREALERYDATWRVLGRPLRTGGAATLAQRLSALKQRQRRRWSQLAGAATLAVILSGLAWWLPRASLSAASTAVVLRPEMRTLPDGSIVEFPAGSEIVVEFSAAIRRVTLKRGEAHFQVAKNPARPFLVQAGRVEVRAVGTAFAVQLGQAAVEVLVTEGRVAIDESASDLSANPAAMPAEPRPLAVVDAGNRVVVEAATTGAQSSPPPVLPARQSEISERLAWRSPRVEFSGTPLGEVVTFLNRHNAVQFVIEDPRLRATALSGRFRLDDSEAFVRMLESGFGATAERREGRIFLRPSR